MLPEKKDSGIERRRYKRVKTSLLVSYRKDEPVDQWAADAQAEDQGEIFDLSEGGIGVITNKELTARMFLRLKFALNWDQDGVVKYYGDLELVGQVRYCGLSGENQYRVGIKFMDIDDAARTQIKNFIEVVEENS